MLCRLCDNVTLHVAVEDAEVEFRRYANLHELRALAERCDFCALLHNEARKLENPDEGEYCKQSWGSKFFGLLLGVSPIVATHKACAGEHNVVISCLLDAQNTPGYPGGPISLDWRSMLGGIYVAEGSALSHVIPGRPFKSNLSAEEQIRLSKARYDQCRLKHDLCRNTLDPLFMPKRVLDLQPSLSNDGDVVRLLLCSPAFRNSYATLSYCWGNAQNVQLTKDTLYSFINEGIRLCDLPTTIKDACKLCKGIGIRYLWVCSLCILQDSESDWSQQSSAMATIYNCSDLTISAAASRNCEAGMLEKQLFRSTPYAKITGQASEGQRGACHVRARLHSADLNEPTETRGWTLQEKLLSRRLLVFGTDQMSWQCATSSWRQNGAIYIPLPGMQEIFPCPLLRYPVQRYDQTVEKTYSESTSVLDVWQRLVRNYCWRNLSLSKDKLPAISGLAKWLSTHYLTGDTYLTGLWRSQLPRNLLWYSHLTFPPSTAEANRPLTYRAPSWTWASLDSKRLEWHETASEAVSSTILHCELSYKSGDPFGEVSSGHLDIQAPLKQGWLVPNGAYPESFDFWDDAWTAELTDLRVSPFNNSLGVVYLDVYDLADVTLASKVSREERARECECLRITDKAGLLLCPTANEGSTSTNRKYQRFGIVVFKERAALWWNKAPLETIRLV